MSSTSSAVTVYISRHLIGEFVSTDFCSILQELLSQGQVPNQHIRNTGKVMGTYVDNYNLDASGGTISLVKILAPSWSQGKNGLFRFEFMTNFRVSYSSWHEWGEVAHLYLGDADDDPFDGTYNDFYCDVIGASLSFDVQLSQSGAVLVKHSQDTSAAKTSAHMPQRSEVSRAICVDNEIEECVSEFIVDFDFSTPLAQALQDLIRLRPDSVYLTADKHVVFEYPCTGMTFPNDDGIATAVTGRVKWQGQPYPADLPALDFPTATSRDLHMLISDYEFNALLWAYYNEGRFSFKVTKDMLPYPDDLTTDAYNNADDPLYALYLAYPHCDMVAYVKFLAPPTVTTGPDGAVTNYEMEVAIKVIQDEEEKPAFTLSVTEQDKLNNFDIAVGKDRNQQDIQVLKFDFVMQHADAELIESCIPDLVDDDTAFYLIWKELRSELAQNLKQIGEEGMPLPHIQNFVSADSASDTISLESGRWSIDTKLKHSPSR